MRNYTIKIILIISFLLTFTHISKGQCGNTYLYLPVRPNDSAPQRGVTIGDLDISGNQLTLEALVTPTSTQAFAHGGDIVSKHCSETNVNYLLRPRSAHITTTNGFFSVVSDTCLQLYQTYHIAMVYNGSTLSLYSNGILIGQTAATGNLVTNDLPARIGREACDAPSTVDFDGFIDQVRIWSTARSQADIQQYMNTDLTFFQKINPNLKAYYIFSSYNNQAFSGGFTASPQGTVYIGRALPKCPSLTVNQCPPTSTLPLNPPVSLGCDHFLKIDDEFSGVTIGDLDLGGNQLTVEAVFRRTADYDRTGEGGDLVSKHSQASDANFFLRPNAAVMRVGNTFYKITSICEIDTGETYHVAMVYDGSTFTFYRNGEIQGSLTTIGGNLGTNNWPMRIGTEANQQTALPIHFIGYINEVRIWNVARSFDSIYYNYRRAMPYIPSSLIAYYNFDNLNNKAGSGWNGTLFGDASINQTDPHCSNGYVNGPICIPLSRLRRNPSPREEPEVNMQGTVIYPNPATSVAYVRFTSTDDKFVTIRLFDVSGKLLSEQKEATSQGINNIRVDNLHSLKPGLYIVQIIGSHGSVQKKLIIQ